MPDGATYREHMLAAERAGANTGELDAPALPAGCDELYTLFWQLRRNAGNNGMSPNAISFADVLAWQSLFGVALRPDEIDAVFAMDNAAISKFAEQQKQTKATK